MSRGVVNTKNFLTFKSWIIVIIMSCFHDLPFFFFSSRALAYGILGHDWSYLAAAAAAAVPQPGIQPRVLAVIVLSPNHWTTREFPYDLPNSIPSVRNDPSTPDHI